MASGTRQRRQTALLAGPFLFIFFQRVVRAYFRSQRKIGQRLAAEHRINKECHQQRKSQGGRVKDTADAPPAGLIGIVENLFRHRSVCLHRSTWHLALGTWPNRSMRRASAKG